MKRFLLSCVPLLVGAMIFALFVMWGRQINPDFYNPDHIWRGTLFIFGGAFFFLGAVVTIVTLGAAAHCRTCKNCGCGSD